MNVYRYNRTKIIATIGPATRHEHVLEKIITEGADVCRINSSHGDHAMMQDIIQTVRRLNDKLNTHIAILFDLQGPKIRIGDLAEDKIQLKEGDKLIRP